MAKCFEIKDGRLVFLNNGESYIDDEEKLKIKGNFTEIVFPACLEDLYNDDFKACRSQLAKVTKLDFSKATKINSIDDDTFTGASSLEVVVLPKEVTSINEFQRCPKLKEIHIYKLEDLYSITKDKDKRLTIYASRVSSDLDCFDDGFLADVGILYVPASRVENLKKARDEYEDELDIRPLPDGYSFPSEALSEPWKPDSGNQAIRKQGSYGIVMDKVGPSRLATMTVIKDICGFGLRQAKEFLESVDNSSNGVSVLSAITLGDARMIKQKLEETGASVRIVSDSACSDVFPIKSVEESRKKEEDAIFNLNQIFGGPQYYCVLEGKSFGPITLRQYANMARFGIVDKNTLVWKEGMRNWAAASYLTDFQAIV